MAFADLREYLEHLKSRGLLHEVDTEVDPTWEITAVTRTMFTQFPAERRKALRFNKVLGHDSPVVIGTIGASPGVYAAALGVELTREGILERWSEALTRPIAPELVQHAPCQEIVLRGDDVNLYRFPIPVATPGKDKFPYLTAPCMISKDPETGIQNAGVYRMQVKGRDRTAVSWDLPSQHGAMDYAKYEARGEAMPIAVVLGPDPTVLLGATAKAPYGLDELAVAGGLRGQALPVVRALTSDLLIPATAEIVLEGKIAPGYREPEGPFGEYTGFMGPPHSMPIFHIEVITHRRRPIFQAFMSQMPPSESSLLRQLNEEANVYKHLVKDLRIPGIVDIHLPESGSSSGWLWISMKPSYPGHARQVMSAAWTHSPSMIKYVVAVDDDVDIRDAFVREWALSWRVEPAKDCWIMPNTGPVRLDPSTSPPEVPLWERMSSKLFIDATKNWPYPETSVALPEYLERARSQWDRYGLPKLPG